mmetsp:Transcript_7823/g.13470  ORF Transcript_7823/g.13470 Transcript_7823/m.13470 type:complete len:443 (-) Transcript_7823:1690-3018(-)
MLQDERVQLEAGLVEDVSEHSEDLLHEVEEVRLVELIAELALLERLKHLEQQVEAHLRHVALGVSERPDDRVYDKLEILRREREQRAEAVVSDGSEEREELQAVLWVVLEVARDHLQRALEDGIKHARHLVQQRVLHLVEDRGEQRQHLGIAGVRQVARVVPEDGIHHHGHQLLRHQHRVVCLLYKRLDQPQALALHLPHQLNLRGPCGEGVALGDDGGDELGVEAVHVEHVGVDERDLRLEGLPQGLAHRHVCLQNVRDVAHDRLLPQHLRARARLVDDLVPGGVRRLHELGDILLAALRLRLRVDHLAHRFVEDVDLVRLQVLDRVRQGAQQLAHERLRLVQLLDDKLPLTLAGDLEERVARHVLHSGVHLVHELEQFVDHRLEELPVCAQKARVLADDVHNVGGNDSLVVLPPRELAQVQQVPDHRHQELVLHVLHHGP